MPRGDGGVASRDDGCGVHICGGWWFRKGVVVSQRGRVARNSSSSVCVFSTFLSLVMVGTMGEGRKVVTPAMEAKGGEIRARQ
ncbi:hypothetical protein SESBI_01478 [Sesbania bispinosa]|nr:hypothetical protein SESBI_01478 [Sesbania bispinosa]